MRPARLDRYNRTLFQTNDDVRRLGEQVAELNAALRVEVVRRTGGRFTPEMTVREAQLLHPESEVVLSAFHLGGCEHCAVDPNATLLAVGRERGLDVNVLLANLNALLTPSHSVATTERQRVKVPNVQIEFDG